MRPARAIVFDLDGTLVDTREDIAAACNHALVALGRSRREKEVIAGFVGDGARRLMARALDVPVDDPIVTDAAARFDAFYAAHPAAGSRWMPGALDALEACAHLPVALVTNKPRAATLAVIDALGATSRFRAIVAGGDGPLKPDPAPVRAALAPLRIAPKDAWVVGDGPQDIGAGRGAGAWTVGVLGGFAAEAALRQANPHRLLASLHAFASLLREDFTEMA